MWASGASSRPRTSWARSSYPRTGRPGPSARTPRRESPPASNVSAPGSRILEDPLHKILLLSINALYASVVSAQAPSPPSPQSKLSVHWEELSAAEFRDAIGRARGTCLLPFGILEKHGPHLPLGNDLLNVRYVALNAAQQEYAIVFPEYYFGQIFEAKHQPG